MLVQSRYMQHTEAVMKNPILFGDYRSAKNVRLSDDPCYGLNCSLLPCLLGCFAIGCVLLKSTWKTSLWMCKGLLKTTEQTTVLSIGNSHSVELDLCLMQGEEGRLYEDLGTFDLMKPVVEELLAEYNSKKKPMNLVFFDDAIEHLTRIHRILRLQQVTCSCNCNNVTSLLHFQQPCLAAVLCLGNS